MRSLLVALVLLCAAGAPGTALAAPPALDMRGTWTQTSQSPYGGGTSTITITSMDCTTGAFAGSGTVGGTTWSENGTVDGNTYSSTEVYGGGSSYKAFLDGTATSPDNISGTFRDSFRNNGTTVVGTFTLVRTSVSPGAGCGGSTPTPTPTPGQPTPTPDLLASPTPTPDPLATPGPTPNPALHPTATQVMCTYVVLTSIDTCTATVGDAAPTPTGPTGQVAFQKTEGVFIAGDTCQLTTSPSAPSTGSCSVQYQRPFGSTKFPEIAGNYGGDATHAPSRGATTFLILGGPPNFVSAVPNLITFTTTADANGTKVRTCAATGGPSATRSTLAVRLAAPLSNTISSVVGKLKKADPAATIALGPQIDSALQQAVVELGNKAKQVQEAGSDQAKLKAAQAELEKLQRSIQELQKVIEAGCKAKRDIIKNATVNALAASAAKAPSVILGATTVQNAKAGQVPLSLKLNKKALTKARKGKKTVDVYIRIITVTPSGLLKKGLPRMTVKKVVIGKDGKLVAP